MEARTLAHSYQWFSAASTSGDDAAEPAITTQITDGLASTVRLLPSDRAFTADEFLLLAIGLNVIRHTSEVMPMLGQLAAAGLIREERSNQWRVTISA